MRVNSMLLVQKGCAPSSCGSLVLTAATGSAPSRRPGNECMFPSSVVIRRLSPLARLIQPSTDSACACMTRKLSLSIHSAHWQQHSSWSFRCCTLRQATFRSPPVAV